MNTNELQSVFKWVRIVLVVLAVFLALEALGVLKALRSVDPTYNSISVTGEGEFVSVPDIATFSFTVSVDDKEEVSKAQNQVTKNMDKILAGLKALGADEKDIKTSNYSVYPKYVYRPVSFPTLNQGDYQDGYTVDHTVLVKIRDTKKAGEALSLVGENGAKNISSLSFTTDDPGQIVEKARIEAIKDAKEKAQMLADELGVRLVRIISFYDNQGPMPYFSEGMGGDFVKTSSSVPTIPIGQNKVTVSVTINYEIR